MFSQVIGQTDIKMRLISEARTGRIPHAVLFSGTPGCGKLALAVSYARYLLCQQPDEYDACGKCPSCKILAQYAHPDLHFTFPIIRYKNAESSVSDVYLDYWRQRLQTGLYFDLDDWLTDMKAGNQQALIYSAEAGLIQRKLSLKSSLGGRDDKIRRAVEKIEQVVR